jgi:hypothetical protein
MRLRKTSSKKLNWEVSQNLCFSNLNSDFVTAQSDRFNTLKLLKSKGLETNKSMNLLIDI